MNDEQLSSAASYTSKPIEPCGWRPLPCGCERDAGQTCDCGKPKKTEKSSVKHSARATGLTETERKALSAKLKKAKSNKKKGKR